MWSGMLPCAYPKVYSIIRCPMMSWYVSTVYAQVKPPKESVGEEDLSRKMMMMMMMMIGLTESIMCSVIFVESYIYSEK